MTAVKVGRVLFSFRLHLLLRGNEARPGLFFYEKKERLYYMRIKLLPGAAF